MHVSLNIPVTRQYIKVLGTFPWTKFSRMSKVCFKCKHFVKNAPQIFERLSSNTVIEGNVQGGLILKHEYLVTLISCYITFSGRGYKISPVCVCVCLSTLSRLNRLTYGLKIWWGC